MVRNITLDVIAKKRSEDLEKLAAQFDRNADAMDKAGVSAKGYGSTLDTLDREITSHRLKVQQLGEEYNKTGSVDAFRNLKSAKKELTDFERLAKELGATLGGDVKVAVVGADAELDRLAVQFDRAGASAHKHTSTLQMLNREIANHRVKVRELASEYDRTGSVDAFRNLRSAKKELADFERLAKELGKVLPGEVERTDLSFRHLRASAHAALSGIASEIPMVGRAMSGLVKAIPPEISIPVALVVGAGTVTTAVASAGGAALAGLALGGIGTGIALQMQSPEVSAAVASLGEKIKSVFVADSHGFGVQITNGVKILNAELDRLDPKISKIFANLQTYVNPLVQGAAKGIDGLVTGIERASGRLGPVITIVARDLGYMGDKAGEAIAIISQGSKGGAEALHNVVLVIGDILIFTSKLILAFEKTYDALAQVDAKLSSMEAKLLGWVPIIGPMIKDHARASDNLANSTTRAAMATDDLKGSVSGLTPATQGATVAVDGLAGAISNATTNTARWNKVIEETLTKNLSLDEANISSKLAVSQFADAVKGNSTAMAGNSTAALQLQSQLLSAIGTLQRTREAQITASGSARAATEEYNREVQKLLDLAKQAGLSKTELEKLAREYRVDVVTTYSYRGKPPDNQKLYSSIPTGRIGGAADGGPIRGGVPTWVGEEGPEIFVPRTSGTVIPNGAAMGGGSPVAGGSSGPLMMTVAGDGALAGMLIKLFNSGAIQIRTRSGELVTVS